MAIFKSHRGVDWHYEVCGDGPALLLIHGFGGSSAWWFGQVDFLKTDFRLLLVDLPGHGGSSFKPLSPSEIAQELRQLTQMVLGTELGIIACSMGGIFALELQRQIPDLVMRVSFVGSMPKFARSAQYPAGLDIEKIKGLSAQFAGDNRAILDMFFRSLFTYSERDSEAFQAVKAMRDKEAAPSAEALRHYLYLLETYDGRDRLSGLICPVQCIAGREDYICPPSMMLWLEEHIHNVRCDIMEGCGHLPMMTHTQEYNRLIEDFLLN